MNGKAKNAGIALIVVLAAARPGMAGAQEGSRENATSLAAQRVELAESILAAKERSLGEPLDLSIRASLKSRMEALPVEQLKNLAERGEFADLPAALGSVTSDLVYTPVTPCRVFDSRVSQGGPGPIPANTQRNVVVAGATGFPAQGGTAGGCGVPLGATSAIINFVTVQPSGAGNIRAWAVANPQPVAPLAAIMNYGAVAGLPAMANGVAVPLCNPYATSCALGDLRLQADTSSTDILGDVVGYFGPATLGIVPIANGGTGSATKNFVDLTNSQTVGGNKTLTGNLTVNGTVNVNNDAAVDGTLTVNNGKGVAYNAASGTNLRIYAFTTPTFFAVLPGFGLSAEGSVAFNGGFTGVPRVFVGDIDVTGGTTGQLYRVQLQLYGCSTTSGVTSCKARLLNTSPNPVDYSITWNCVAIGN